MKYGTEFISNVVTRQTMRTNKPTSNHRNVLGNDVTFHLHCYVYPHVHFTQCDTMSLHVCSLHERAWL